METVKESWGASCPKCGDDNCLEVSFVAWGLLVADNGFDDDGARDGSHEFDDASACQCQACGWRGTFGQACGNTAQDGSDICPDCGEGDEPDVKAAATLSRPALIDAAREAEALNGPALLRFTAFCQQADGGGTILIQRVGAADMEAAKLAAREQCAADWGYDVADVHCLGLAEGNCKILDWDDLGE